MHLLVPVKWHTLSRTITQPRTNFPFDGTALSTAKKRFVTLCCSEEKINEKCFFKGNVTRYSDVSFVFRYQSCYTSHTTKTQYRKFETNIPRKVARCQSQFPHSCVCERLIYTQDRSAYSAAGKYVYPGSGNIWSRTIPFLGRHKWDFCCSVVKQPHSLE